MIETLNGELMMKLARQIAARVGPSTAAGCHVWSGSLDAEGYGRVSVRGRWRWAHRLVWELANGSIPDGLFVCHRCDNPPCCNPAHLFLGTNADNMADMVAKGRGLAGRRSGEDNPNHKLTSVDVKQIRALLEHGSTQVKVARLFSVSRRTVREIRDGLTWRVVQ